MKIASLLAFSTLLLSIQAIKYFRGNDVYGNEITNPNIRSTPDTINSDAFNPDVASPGYFDNNSQDNVGNVAASKFGQSFGQGSQLYPNLYSLTIGAQNYGSTGGLNTVDNFGGSGGQFDVDGSGDNMYNNAQNGFGSNVNSQDVYGANLYPGLSAYSNLGSPSYGNVDYTPNSGGNFGYSTDQYYGGNNDNNWNDGQQFYIN